MANVEIRAGDVEPIYVDYYQNGTVVLGASVSFTVLRTSDGLQLDFADNTFKSNPGTPTKTMTDPNGIGHYAANLDTSTFTNPVSSVTEESYVVKVTDTGSSVILDDHELRIRAISLLPASIASLSLTSYTNPTTLGGAISRIRKWLTWTSTTLNKKRVNPVTQKYEVYDDDGVTLLDNPVVADSQGNNVTPQTGELSRIG